MNTHDPSFDFEDDASDPWGLSENTEQARHDKYRAIIFRLIDALHAAGDKTPTNEIYAQLADLNNDGGDLFTRVIPWAALESSGDELIKQALTVGVQASWDKVAAGWAANAAAAEAECLTLTAWVSFKQGDRERDNHRADLAKFESFSARFNIAIQDVLAVSKANNHRRINGGLAHAAAFFSVNGDVRPVTEIWTQLRSLENRDRLFEAVAEDLRGTMAMEMGDLGNADRLPDAEWVEQRWNEINQRPAS
jgi:hypothetical protein